MSQTIACATKTFTTQNEMRMFVKELEEENTKTGEFAIHRVIDCLDNPICKSETEAAQELVNIAEENNPLNASKIITTGRFLTQKTKLMPKVVVNYLVAWHLCLAVY